MDDPAPENALGAAGDAMPLWRAREALRHGEMKLNQMSAQIDTIRGQATSILGWSSALGTAMGIGAFATAHPWMGRLAVSITIVEVGLCIKTIWPIKRFAYSSLNPVGILAWDEPNELAQLTDTVRRMQKGIDNNRRIIDARSGWLMWAWFGLPAIPIVVGIAGWAVS